MSPDIACTECGHDIASHDNLQCATEVDCRCKNSVADIAESLRKQVRSAIVEASEMRDVNGVEFGNAQQRIAYYLWSAVMSSLGEVDLMLDGIVVADL